VRLRGKEAVGKALARGARTAKEACIWWARGLKNLKLNDIRTAWAWMRRADGAKVTDHAAPQFFPFGNLFVPFGTLLYLIEITLK